MPDLGPLQGALAGLRKNAADAAAEARNAVLAAERLKIERASLGRTGSREAQRRMAALNREISALEDRAAAKRSEAAAAGQRIHGELDGFIRLPDYDPLAGLDGQTPFLLFPVRLETKFSHAASGLALRVRIYPDTINISTHDPLLSEGERDAGRDYWTERARALSLTESERRGAERGAWLLLAARFGGPRARYIARQRKPSPWPSVNGSGGAPVGPAPLADDETVRLSHSIAPASARLLPDHFIVVGYDETGKEVARASGMPIPDDLRLGPDPEALEAELVRDPNGRLAADPKLKWMIDFQTAVDTGMALVLEVPAELQEKGFHRLVAFGVKLSMDAETSAKALEELLGEHRFTGGVDLLRNGSPTNNNEDLPSGFTSDHSADEALVAVEVDDLAPVATIDHGHKGDAQRLSEALGISFETVADWPSAPEAADIADALAMNRALWPATLGRFVKDLAGDAVPATLKAPLETFFLTYVTGRTLLPSIRVGRQPYGLLATADLSGWAEAREGRDQAAAMTEIASALAWFRRKFESVGSPAQIGGGGDEALANSMRVIGQLASSVAFSARKGVTDEAAWNTLNYSGVIPMFALNWWRERVAAREASFADLPAAFKESPFAQLVLFFDADPLAVPVVDQDPAIPLSEKARLSTFDGTRNYIDWLLGASTDELRSETFRDADGTVVSPPTALLYRMLHDAWTQQLVSSSKDLFTRLHAELVATGREGSLVNIREQSLSDTHSPMFDAAALGLATNPRMLGDHLLDVSIAGSPAHLASAPEALALLSQRASLEHLAALSTAALERLFAEHVDLASYRLDAWQTGLVARRLDAMRRARDGARGICLGAYGYVENLAPKPEPRAVKPAELPESLRSNDVREQDGNGGFVHAPSLGHAVTAAVLRNAYLTHAEPSIREAMSVNLTSRRARSALALIEGVRGGQELAALLGYQFERGLHENHPGVELDALIYALRARFPLVSRRLTPVPDGTPAERIEARNVIDGLSLIEAIRDEEGYPHGITELPGAATNEGKAIIAELDRLQEALDAVADLVLAEGVHQAVQSNIDRARGIVGAAGEGEVPPIPDVLFTPRSGRVFTQRLALHLPASGPGWLASPTPRAAANPGLNAWLAAQLPDPSTVGLQIRRKGAAPASMTLDAAGLEPIDVVLMSGDRFGDGSSELERVLADRWCAENGVGDEFGILFKDPDGGIAEGQLVVDLATHGAGVPLGGLLTLLRSLRRLVGSARALHAQDYRLAADAEKANARNPKGYALDGAGDLASLPGTLGDTSVSFADAVSPLVSTLDGLKASYEAVRTDGSSFDPASWSGPLGALRGQLRSLFLFGLAEALPRSTSGTTLSAALALYEQGRSVAAIGLKRLEAADAALAALPPEPSLADPAAEDRRVAARLDQRVENLLEAGRQLLGPSFVLQPGFSVEASAQPELDAVLAAPVEDDVLAIEGWLQSLSRVRPRMSDAALAIAATSFATGREPRLVPVQLPRRPGDPWIAQGWTQAPADGEVLSVVAIDPPASMGGIHRGLLVDEWNETVPGPEETTGLAFHFDRPNAAAPQSLLLVTPSQADGRWRKDELPNAILDTFARARLRAIEPDHVTASSLFPVLPMTLSRFARHQPFAAGLYVRDVVHQKFPVE